MPANLRSGSPAKNYRSRQDGALLVEIPYYLLKGWHGKADKSDPEVNAPNYITLVNDLIPGKCARISQESGPRINNDFHLLTSLSTCYNFAPRLYILLPLRAVSKSAEKRLFSAT